MNIPKFTSLKGKQKLSMVTCYDSSFARIVESSGIDAVLVGDSVGMTIYGHKDTLSVDVEMIERHVKAVRTSYTGIIVADVPFLEVQKEKTDFIEGIKKLISAGANAVKIEGLKGQEEYIKLLVDAGVPVMGHLGLTPQHYHKFGGFKVQGREEVKAKMILEDAKKLNGLGCFSIVLECVPEDLAGEITDSVTVPTIGIGAGVGTDGQILVIQDLLGMNKDFKPKFVRQFLNGEKVIGEALKNYDVEVKSKTFPLESESFQVSL